MRISFCLLLLFFVLPVFGQTPQQVPLYSKTVKTADWYRKQSAAWNKVTKNSPRNENAWRNYYLATRYAFDQDKATSVEYSAADVEKRQKALDWVIKEMARNIPNTFTLHLFQYYNSNNSPVMASSLLKAMNMKPNEIDAYPCYINYLLLYENNDEKIAGIARKWFDSNDYSPYVLNYNYNEMVGLENHSIIFVSGDNSLYPKVILQHACDLFLNINVLSTDMLAVREYREKTLRRLGIPDFTKVQSEYASYNEFTLAIIKHIIANAGKRAVYFSNFVYPDILNDLVINLHNEGLVLRYNSASYDNVAVIKRNYERLYLTDYLKQPFVREPYSDVTNWMNLNYIPALLPLYDHYKMSDDKIKATELGNILKSIAVKAQNSEYTQMLNQRISQ